MTDQLILALIAAGSAIVASVGAQIIGAAISHRTEQRRLEREDSQREREDKEREIERFSDNKRAAFVGYLQVRNEYRRVCQRLYLEGPSAEREKVLTERARTYGAEIERIEEEIGLLDPDVYDEILTMKDRIGSIRTVDPNDERALHEWFLKDFLAVGSVRTLMHASLAISRRFVANDKGSLQSVSSAEGGRPDQS